MRSISRHRGAEINTSSVADVAFLLLSFFLMTTVIASEKGLPLTLPEWRSTQVQVPIHQRNLFKIQINSNDQLMIQGEPVAALEGVKEQLKMFILNNGKDPMLSVNPGKAIVSLKADRGTSHGVFVEVLDEIHAAYYEIYGERIGVSPAAFRKLSYSIPAERALIDKAKSGIPMNVSIAEPTKIGH